MEVRVRVRSLLALVVLSLCASACGDKDSPTAPTTPPAATRIIRLEGNMNFGSIQVGSSHEAVLRIHNDGNETLNVTGLTGPGAGVVTASWTSGGIAPGTSQASTIRFTPTTAQTYTGNVTVNGNHTGGTNTLPFSATGVFPPRPDFSRSGVGDTVFDMPLDVARIRVVGTYNGSSQNFIMRIGGRLIVNEIIGTCCGNVPRYEGTLLTGGGGAVEIRSSSGVSWSIQEIR
jgi:hypothetical protein